MWNRIRRGDTIPLSARRKNGKDSVTESLRQLPEEQSDPWQVVFQIMTGSGEVVGAKVQEVVVVGRSDAQSNSAPGLDFAPYGAQEHGVSRRHAILMPIDEGLCLIDLDSANGTQINGNRLTSGKRYRLRSGDRVEFGTLRVIVRVAGQMKIGRDEAATLITQGKSE